MNSPITISIDSETFLSLIKGELSSNSSYSRFYTKEKKSGELSVTIQDCEIEQIYLHEKTNYPFKISIKNSKFKGLFISDGIYEDLSLNDIIIDDNNSFAISGGEFRNFFISGDIGCDSYISKASFDKCYFGNVDFKKSITIQSGNFKQAYFSGIKAKSLFIRGGKFKEFLLAGGAHLNDCDLFGLYFSGGSFEKIHVYGLSKINKIHVTSGFIETMILESEGIAEISVKNHAEESKELTINSLFLNQLGKINFSSKDTNIKLVNFNDSFINKDTVLRFSDMTIGALNFNNIINYGQITFNKISLANRLSIQQSDLGKTTLINCDLSLSKLSFESSKITDVFLAGTDMPSSMVATTHKEMRSAYGQIKKIYDNRGDSINAGIFFAKEINSYYDLLSFKRDGWEKFNLTLNKYSTNHGQSWKRGLISLLFSSLLTYIFYCLIIGLKLDFSSGISGWHLFIKAASYFFEYLNPVHKTDFVLSELGKNTSPDAIAIARIWEGISRIITGYLLYQFVQAFRKFGKK
jgi:uncharacterized protein YjbI with pentapeptide repeats